jgi:hypothetical protein
MRLLVKPFPEVIDHCFKYLLPENRMTKLNIPLNYTFGKIPIGEPNFFVSYDKAHVYWKSYRNPIISLKTPKAGEILRFNLLCYEDQY